MSTHPPSDLSLEFLGAAGTVTGSKFLLKYKDSSIMVDCGLFQGLKSLRLMNWEGLAEIAKNTEAVVLTHAHLDHSGYLPRFISEGFKGPVFCTEPTRDLCQILLPDSGYIHEEEARYAGKKGFSKHNPPLPLYTEAQAQDALKRFKIVNFRETFKVGPFEMELIPAGHILGAASLYVRVNGRSLLFSGDIGRPNDPLMKPPELPRKAHTIVMESTYGDRLHSEQKPVDMMTEVLEYVVTGKGTLLIPSFAVGRAQSILHCLHQTFMLRPDLRLPIFVNSPMATNVTQLYLKHHQFHKLSPQDCESIFAHVTYVNSVEESQELNKNKGPKIIVSASGMLTGGRILHHIKAFGDNPRNAILLPGFQAEGTRGAALKNGARELKIHGDYHPVLARVFVCDNLSAHADQSELLDWLKQITNGVDHLFLVHGEAGAADTLRAKISHYLGLNATIPRSGGPYLIGSASEVLASP